ncbi:uncharacterized protein LOC112084492 [Eutrema salsugineum]|uniref:uncharacterized protein LOC112084492 n=1 Tax=Eutrema salsugineum TaxID=72664 RepID=UPI000CED2956|nr:uncharacterized protein LOC112084492 [Eutrema salsugineum]
MIESSRLRYFRNNQKKLRSDKYMNLVEAEKEGTSDLSNRGKRILIPASFTGGSRYMNNNYLDAMAIYRPDILCRIFKIKLDSLMSDLTEKNIFRKSVCILLNSRKEDFHMHISYYGWRKKSKLSTAESIDKVISAEIPDKDSVPVLYEVVKQNMIHRPCGVINKSSPCMARSIKYLFKYINKGPDRVLATIEHDVNQGAESVACANVDENGEDNTDEIKEYFDCRQQKNRLAVGRITYVPLKCGQLYYLRVLLNRHKCPKGFDDLKTVDGVLHPTYKDACYALGLLDDDREYIDGINEASMWGSGDFLRKLFCVMLLTDSLINPFGVWEETWNLLSDDILYRRRLFENNPELDLSDEQLKNYTLDAIETILQSNGGSLSNYDGMPLPEGDYNTAGINRLIYDERNYDREEMKAIVERMVPGLTDEQMNVYKEIMEAVTEDKGKIFFLYGFGGTGYCLLLGIASLLLPGGRTAHSRFSIPINPDDDTTCNIQPGTDLGNLVAESSLIIWDEAPMMSRYCFESLDRTMRDIIKRHKEKPFGGKVVVFGGDFRQILPVISGEGMEDIVMASINSSYLWDDCKVLMLTKNMRLLANLDETVAE